MPTDDGVPPARDGATPDVLPTIPPPHPDPHPPRRVDVPPRACDAHCHVFGPADRFPFAAERSYTPPDAGLERIERLRARLGLERAVFVQASCHGTDNAALLDALACGRGRYAGVVMVDDTVTDAALRDMHRLGVRGVRFNFVRHLPARPDLAKVWRTVDRVRPLGWHVVLHLDADDLATHAAFMQRLPVPFVIDHMGRVDAGAGVDQPAVEQLLALARDGRCWVKLSGAERSSRTGAPGYDDVVPVARAIIDAAPDRVLWGTDWPHPNVPAVPDDGDLVDLLADVTDGPDQLRRILVDNPARLYEFAA